MVSLVARSPLGGRRRTRVRRKPRVLGGYRRILVPIGDNPESEEAIDVAARLAAEHGSSIVAIAVVEVPSHLPADAHMRKEEGHAHTRLHRAAAVAEKYGVGVSVETVRGRDVASAIVAELFARRIEVVVIGAPRRPGSRAGVSIFGKTVEHVLKKAPCRVMIVGTMLRSRPAA